MRSRYGDASDEGEQRAMTKRQEARLKLLQNTCAVWSADEPLLYYARPGALSNTQRAAADEIYSYFHDGFLMSKPTVPALNRWNKVPFFDFEPCTLYVELTSSYHVHFSSSYIFV